MSKEEEESEDDSYTNFLTDLGFVCDVCRYSADIVMPVEFIPDPAILVCSDCDQTIIGFVEHDEDCVEMIYQMCRMALEGRNESLVVTMNRIVRGTKAFQRKLGIPEIGGPDTNP